MAEKECPAIANALYLAISHFPEGKHHFDQEEDARIEIAGGCVRK
jgi:hypothetical protein